MYLYYMIYDVYRYKSCDPIIMILTSKSLSFSFSLLSCYFVTVTTYVFIDILEELAHVRRKRNKNKNTAMTIDMFSPISYAMIPLGYFQNEKNF